MNATVEALDLRTYRAKFDNTKCTLCRGAVNKGEQIALIPKRIRSVLNRLGMSLKVYKYAHVSCLPVLLPEDYTPDLQDAAEYLMNLTDPEWPKDHMGFNSGDAPFAQKWLGLDCPQVGSHYMAKRLVKYLDTQLDGKDSEQGQRILDAAAWAPVSRRAANSNGSRLPKEKTNSAPSEAPERCDLFSRGIISDKVSQGGVKIVALVGSDLLRVTLLPYWESEEHGKIKDAIKIGGASWGGRKDLSWYISPAGLAHALDAFANVEVSIDKDSAAAIAKAMGRRELSGAAKADDTKLKARLDKALPDGLALYPFQEAGVAFLEAAKGKALLADDLGLGKTCQALAYLAINPELRPALVIVPAVVAPNWTIETKKWIPDAKVHRVRNGKDAIPSDAQIVVITYDLAHRRVEDLIKLKPKSVICDESQYVRNYRTKRAQAVLSICKAANPSAILCLSGTPLVNRPVEFYTTLNLLRPETFRSWKWFTARYCGGHQGHWGYVCDGATNLEELHSRLKDLMVRRLKSDVLTELPEKTRIDTPVELNNKEIAAYNRAVREAYEANDNHLAAITAARRAIGKAKVRSAVAWIEEYYSQSQPVLVFAHHEDVRQGLVAGAKKAGCRVGHISGKVSQDARQKRVDEFQAGELDVMIISTQAGGVGITLTAASNVIFVEMQWTPSEMQQAADRVHRIGQKNAVTVRYLLANVEIDRDMNELLTEKAKVISAALDGTGATPEDTDIRKELVRRWAGRKRT